MKTVLKNKLELIYLVLPLVILFSFLIPKDSLLQEGSGQEKWFSNNSGTKIINSKVESTDAINSSAGHNSENHNDAFRINSISFYHLPIGQRDDFVSFLLNFFHWRTEETFIRQELLFDIGGVTDSKILLETEKNLMATGLFTQAFVQKSVQVPGKEDIPNYDVVVVSRDTFSLLGYVDGGISGGNRWAVVEGGDENFLGKGYFISLKNYTDLYTKKFSQTFKNQRLLGTRWTFRETVGIQVDNSGNKEGDFQQFDLSYPLYSTQTKWGAKITFDRNDIVDRKSRAGQIALVQGTGIPYVYRKEEYRSKMLVLRSFGTDIKFDVYMGLGFWESHKNPFYELDNGERNIFYQIIRERSDAYSILSFHLYENRFALLLNYQSLDIQEYILNGLSLKYEIQPGFGYDKNYSRKPYLQHNVRLNYVYILPWKDIVEIRNRSFGRFIYNNNLTGDSSFDKYAYGEIGYHFRWKKFGSLIFKAYASRLWDGLYLDLIESQSTFRGYLYNEFRGDRLWRIVSEFRTISLRVWYLAIGLVAFYEMESLGLGNFPRPIRALGGGLRFIMPEVKGSLIRADFTYPLDASDNNIRERFLSVGYFQHL